jgi:hypothetical protein
MYGNGIQIKRIAAFGSGFCSYKTVDKKSKEGRRGIKRLINTARVYTVESKLKCKKKINDTKNFLPLCLACRPPSCQLFHHHPTV